MAPDRRAALWRLVAKGTGAIIPFNECRQGTPFYCVHSIYGDVTSLQLLARQLGDEGPVYGVQAPKERMSGAFAASIEDLAHYYVDALTSFQPTGALMLGGWSVGAIIALEMAQQLLARGREVALLAVFDGNLRNTGSELGVWDPILFWKCLHNLPHWYSDYLLRADWPHKMARQIKRSLEFRRTIPKVILKLKTSLSMPAPCGGAQVRRHPLDGVLSYARLPEEQISFARALSDAAETYVPKSYGGRALVYVARTRPLLPGRSPLSPLSQLFQIEAAWKLVCPSAEMVHVKGMHSGLMSEPWVGPLGTDLRRRLNEVRREYASSVVDGANSAHPTAGSNDPQPSADRHTSVGEFGKALWRVAMR
jgi:thioesterase domain-containing protein